MKFERYSEYKDSGIDWLGDIPSDWEVKRLKDLGRAIIGLTYSPNDIVNENCGILVLRSSNIQHTKVDLNNNVYVNAKIPSKLITRKNDILICSRNGSRSLIGKNAKIDENSQGLTFGVFTTIFRGNNNNFIFWVLNSLIFESQSGMFVTSTINQLTVRNLNNFEVPVFSGNRIANYLDTQTAKIDKQVALLEQKIQKYQELKQALINETVLRGLDKTTPLKDSGIEWIGDIPQHWEVKRFKDIAVLFTGNSISNKELFANINNSYPYIATKDIDINTGKINYDNGIYIPENNINFKVLRHTATLLCIEGGSAGKKIAYTAKNICFVNKLCAFKVANGNFANRFVFYLIHSFIFKNQFFSIINGLIGGVSINSIKKFICIQPSLQEQTQIANYLDEKTSKIDAIIQTMQTQTTTLTEFRKTLINDAVTGKIKVA